MRVVTAVAAAAAAAAGPSGPSTLGAPASFPWRAIVNGSGAFRYGAQPSAPALDGSGGVVLSAATTDARCATAVLQDIVPDAARRVAASAWRAAVPVAGVCVAPAAGLTAVSDPLVSVAAGVAAVVFDAIPNATAGAAGGGASVAAAAVNLTTGAPAWAAAALPAGLLAAAPVANGSSFAIVVGAGGNTSVVVIDAATGATLAAHPLPASACNGSVAAVTGAAAGTTAAGGDVLFLSASASAPSFTTCAWAWVVTGPAAGQVVWAAPSPGAAPAFPPVVDPAAPGVGVFLTAAAPAGAGGLVATAVSADTGAVVWTATVSPDETVVAGAAARGGAVFVVAATAVWRGCAAPGPTMYALDATNGSAINALPLTRLPDIGWAGNLVASDPAGPAAGPRGAGVQLYWRETNGWGLYDSYLTAATFTGSYWLVTGSWVGHPSGALGAGAVNVAHDDSATTNPVRGCPPALDALPGTTGALAVGPSDGQLLIVDWAGLQVFEAATAAA
jgi:hypothetical protein